MNQPSAWHSCCEIEAGGIKDIIEFIRSNSANGQFVVTDKGNLSKELQETVGDVLCNCNNQKIWGIELKTETENKHGNLFLEYWSNLSRYNPGWMLKLQTDLLFYYFLKEKELLIINFRKLKEWAFKFDGKNGKGRIYDFPLKKQGRYEQLNDTWGRCVPIQVIEYEIGLKRINLNGYNGKVYQQAELQI